MSKHRLVINYYQKKENLVKKTHKIKNTSS